MTRSDDRSTKRSFSPFPSCAAVLVAFLSACAPAAKTTGHAGRGLSDGSVPIQECGVRELSRHRLTVGGRPLYVEADAFVADGRGNVLLAGTPTYLWKVSPHGEINGLTSDSVFGAVIARDGTARLVSAPMDPTRIRGIRAAARPDGGWDVVFAEVPADSGSSAPAERLWYGTFDRGRWSSLEPLPLPPGVALSPLLTSSLVRRGDTLAWALTPAMRPGRRDISLFQRVTGRWTHVKMPAGTAADVDLAYSDSLGLVVAVVQPDSTLPRDGNSLLLWTPQPDWRVARRLVHGSGEGRVHDPSLVGTAAGLLATWWSPVGQGIETRYELRARYVGARVTNQPAMMMLDSDVPLGSATEPVVPQGGRPLWTSIHRLTPDPGNDSSEIRFVRAVDGQAIEVGRISNPYRMRMATTTPAAGELLVSGMEYEANRFAFSLLLRMRIGCDRT